MQDDEALDKCCDICKNGDKCVAPESGKPAFWDKVTQLKNGECPYCVRYKQLTRPDRLTVKTRL